jgi:hypothetical protein
MASPTSDTEQAPAAGRVPRSRAPFLYEALGWAVASAFCLVAAILVMTSVNLALGLAVLVICQVGIVLGARAVLRHHRAEDQRRQRERQEYNERLADLMGRATVSAPPSPGDGSGS